MNEQYNPAPDTSGELLDVLDEQGRATGQALDKKTIHRQGLPHRDVHVWLTNGTHVLEQQRHPDKSIMPGVWDISVGGHVTAGESMLSAAVRETEEELGLQLPPERFLPAGIVATEMFFGADGWRHRIFGDNFVVIERGLALEDLTLQASEVTGARWYDIDQLEADLRSPETAVRHAPQPPELWALGIAAMRQAAETQ
ncbi:MAG TPA: NUDIX domain-containing protein [Candidatus Saccharimonadales bacterium]|jgi:isopentenyldiphosphate isomerase|nr:NUDIX domain-containing protein [Candidatus Saccharimonadales bacterium]